MRPTCPSSTAYYDAHADEYFKSSVNLDLHELYESFLKELRPGAHILDAGCGSGRDTKAFLDRGYRVTAIDASPQLARLATAFTRHPCEVLSFQESEFRQEFDGIWACASLLHVAKDEIDDVMARFIRALKPGGTVYISLKEGEGERVSEDGRFFSYYSEDSFRMLLERFPALREQAFWKTKEIRSSSHCEPWLSFLLKKSDQ
jgi:SAM-dependent methyltransferase